MTTTIMHASIRTISFIAVAVGLTLMLSLQSVSAAAPSSVRPASHDNEVNGQLTVTDLSTTNKAPTLSGTMPAECTDLTVNIFQLGVSGQTLLISTLVDGFDIDGTGNWSVNLIENGSTLSNGWHTITLFSDCGYSEDATKDYYYDYYNAKLFVYPAGCDASCVPVHRFYDTKKGVHFYTANESEKTQLITVPGNFVYEGVSSFAKPAAEDGLIPVHRFYNFKQGVHFYTANQAEATNVNDTAFTTYRYEGVSYYTSATQVTDTSAVHRFYNFKNGVHFYTSNQAEATNVNNNAAHTYRYEGIASYNVEKK